MSDDIQNEIDKMMKFNEDERRGADRIPIEDASLTLAWIDRNTNRVEIGNFDILDFSRTGFSFWGELSISHHQVVSFILHFPNSKDLKGYGNIARHKIEGNKTFVGIKFSGLNRDDKK